MKTAAGSFCLKVTWSLLLWILASASVVSVVNDDNSCENPVVLIAEEVYAGDLCFAVEFDNPCFEDDTTYGYWHSFFDDECQSIGFEFNNLSEAPIGVTIYQSQSDEPGCNDLNPLACCGPVMGTCAGDLSSISGFDPNLWVHIVVWTDDSLSCGEYSLVTYCVLTGCTDPYACNYEPDANTDDDSCYYFNCPPDNDFITEAIPIECGDDIVGSNGGSSFALPIDTLACNSEYAYGVWYSFVGTGGWHTLSTCGSTADTQVDIFTSSDNTAEGELSCAADAYTGVPLSEIDDSDVYDGCGFFSQDDVYFQFQSEPNVNYFIYVSSPNSGSWGGFNLSLQCEEFILGCTNEQACNFLSEAIIDDGTCEFFSCACSPECAEGIPVVLKMYDEFGDGWNGASYEVFFENEQIASGDIDSGQVGIDENNFQGNEYGESYFCLCGEGCYAITAGGGSWDNEITWELMDEYGTMIAGGGAPELVPFVIGGETECAGCTDPTACNYVFTASPDNGSCAYPGCTYIPSVNYDPAAGCDDGSCILIGDFDLDGDVDIDDLLALLAIYGCQGPNCYADLNEDQIVNLLDLMLLLGYF